MSFLRKGGSPAHRIPLLAIAPVQKKPRCVQIYFHVGFNVFLSL